MDWEALRASIDKWYAEDPKRERCYEEIVSGNGGFSLRMLDWFVTNMSARKPVVYVMPDSGRVVDVNADYKDTLRCFHKTGFDSFKRRGARHGRGEAVIRQRNFLRWAIKNGVVDYIRRNAPRIEKDMQVSKRRPAADPVPPPPTPAEGTPLLGEN